MFTILDPVTDRKEWNSVLDTIGREAWDPHMSPDYLAAECLATPGVRVGLAVLRDEDGRYPVAKPFVMRPAVVGGVSYGWDITSPHGYGGPAGWPGWHHDTFDCDNFVPWCKGAGIICEYTALNPMHAERQMRQLGPGWTWPITERKQIVWIDVHRVNFSHERRTGIRTAIAAGVKVDIWQDKGTSGFLFTEKYKAAMERKGAAQRWRFPDEYVLAMCRQGITFVAHIDSDVQCMSVVLAGGDVAYYHMTAASESRDPKCRANDLLISEIVEWCCDRGIRRLHLGGGVTSAPDDGVLAFKASFSDLRLPAMSTFRVFDEVWYRAACEAKTRQEIAETGAEFTTRFEPLYRREAV